MAAVASILFALVIKQSQIEPYIEWIFSADACMSCSEAQLELMTSYFVEGDLILISNPTGDSKRANLLMAEIMKRFPDVEVTSVANRIKSIATGWLWTDPVSHEEVMYHSRQFSYSRARASALLFCLRQPNPKR